MSRQNELPVPVFNSNEFLCKSGELIGEASSLNGWKLGQLWNDACDVGIAIRSARTGRIERFYLDSTKVNQAEGELQAWHLLPVDRNIKLKVVVFND